MTYDLFGEASGPTPAPAIGTATIEGVGAMEILHQTPRLQATAKTGKTKYWIGYAGRRSDGVVVTFTEWWLDGGAHQYSTPTIIERKNVGRANETTEADQAIFEIRSAENRQRDEGYVEEGQTYAGLLLPMLAHEFGKRKHDIVWDPNGVFVQPKEDGVRAITDGQRFWSRKGKLFADDVVAHLRFPNPSGVLFDGEFMLRGGTFQETTAYTKKARPDQHRLEFVMFDTVEPERPFSQRWLLLEQYFAEGRFPAGVKLIETIPVADEDEVSAAHARFIERGHEGTMIRADRLYEGRGANRKPGPLCGYRVDERATCLLKKKDFQDAEYRIVEAGEGVGRDAGAIMFRCITPEGLLFDVRPAWDYERRRAAFLTRDTFIGRKITVTFQNLSDDGIPRFPVGKEIRDYE